MGLRHLQEHGDGGKTGQWADSVDSGTTGVGGNDWLGAGSLNWLGAGGGSDWGSTA